MRGVSLVALSCLAAAFAGCLGDGGDSEADPARPAGCIELPPDGACVALDGLGFAARSCVESAFAIELPQETYDLPSGFENSGTTTSPQRLAVAWARCGEVEVAGVIDEDASIGYVAVIVEDPGRGQGGEYNAFDVEVLTDSPRLLAALTAAGFPARQATIEVSDVQGLRRVTVAGDVDYEATAGFVPVEGATINPSESHHSALAWYKQGRTCVMFAGDGQVAVVPLEGELARALPGGAPLSGFGTQAISCEFSARFQIVGDLA